MVTVVIPTRNRPDLVVRAVRSVLAQTFASFEVNVVIDGPDPLTEQRLATVNDERLNIIMLTNSVGGSEARNIGVRNARGEWIAFLDDDDEWFPEKLEKQMNLATLSKHEYPVVSCRLVGRTPKKDYIWPRRLPLPGEDIGDYLFVRKELTKGEAMVQTSTILARKELLLKFPFNEKLKKHQDTEWILQVSKNFDAPIIFVAEPLMIWNIEGERVTVSGKHDWQYTLGWLLENKRILSSRAIASYILTQLSAEASQQKDVTAMWKLLSVAFKEGKPELLDMLLFTAMWTIPRSFRRWVGAFFAGRGRLKENL